MTAREGYYKIRYMGTTGLAPAEPTGPAGYKGLERAYRPFSNETMVRPMEYLLFREAGEESIGKERETCYVCGENAPSSF